MRKYNTLFKFVHVNHVHLLELLLNSFVCLASKFYRYTFFDHDYFFMNSRIIFSKKEKQLQYTLTNPFSLFGHFSEHEIPVAIVTS